MAINFPDSPSTNDTYTYSGKTWMWNGSAWQKTDQTETGNTEGNTGEIAYYDVKGSVIKGATGFIYDAITLGISCAGGLYVSGGATFGGVVNISGAGNYILFPDGTTMGTLTAGANGANGATGADGSAGAVGATGATGPVGDYVESWNGSTGAVDVTSSVIHVGGISADAGATFGGPIGLDSGSALRNPASKGILDVNASNCNIILGDVDEVDNGTLILLRDSHQIIGIYADTSITLSTPTVAVNENIIHSGDPNTKINFATDQISLMVGGVTFAKGTYGAGAGTPLEAPYGLTCGSIGFGSGNIFTPVGVTCGSLEVGGYWAGQHEEVIGINVDNGSQVLTTGKKGHREIPYDCEVTEWTVTSTGSGSIQWDINWCTYVNWATTASVAGSSLPSISSAYKNQDKTVNWTKTTFAAGDIIEFEIDSVTTLTNCTVSLKIRRNG